MWVCLGSSPSAAEHKPGSAPSDERKKKRVSQRNSESVLGKSGRHKYFPGIEAERTHCGLFLCVCVCVHNFKAILLLQMRLEWRTTPRRKQDKIITLQRDNGRKDQDRLSGAESISTFIHNTVYTLSHSSSYI